jgi:hypothetical protein
MEHDIIIKEVIRVRNMRKSRLTMKAKVHKSNYVTFFIQRKQLTKMKSQPTGWEKIFVNYISDKDGIQNM